MQHLESALARKLSSFLRLSSEELECLATLQSNAERITAKTELIYEGQTDHCIYILQAGWAYSYKLLPNGGQQIISFEIPGDLMGMRSILLRTLDHSVAALTDVVVSAISMPRILDVFKAFPRLGAALLWAASRDDAITIEHLVGVGRRSATERVAHFFLELRQRLQLVGLATGNRFECPIRQHLLADALGLTTIHINRVLRQLRENKLITIRGRSVVIDDADGLAKFAGYDSTYLDQSRFEPKLGF
jgi:CRP-like cAMP-binding protein